MLEAKTKERANRRLLILETTLEMIAAGGVDSVTHRRVAAAAQIPLGSTTYYFESREHLLRATFDHYLDVLKEIREEIPFDAESGVDGIVTFLTAFADRELERPEYLQAEYEMTLYASRDPILASAMNDWYDTMVERLAVGFSESGEVNARQAAKTVLHFMRGYELEHLTRKTTDKHFAERLKRLVTVLAT